MITMLLGGLWHGAAWTFVVWGGYHGVLLAGHAWLRRRRRVPAARPLAVAATFLSVVVGWVFFRARNLDEAWQILGSMIGVDPGPGGNLDVIGWPWTVALIVGALAPAFLGPNSWEIRFPRTRLAAALLALLLVGCLFRFAQPTPFLYFQF